MTTAETTLTVDQLIAEYAQPIALVVDLDPSDYDRTAGGFAHLLADVAHRLSSFDQTYDWLDEAADDLSAIARLGDGGKKTQNLLKRVDKTLYEAREELADL